MKILKYVKMFLYVVIQWTWGILQSLLGLFLLAKYRYCKRTHYHGSICVYHNGKFGGVSLGMFIFVNGTRDEQWIRATTVHEYGHTIQSLILGPLYMFVIGMPSMVWCNSKKFISQREEKGVSYFKFYPEKYANILGSSITKEAPPTIESGIPKVYFEKQAQLLKKEKIQTE